MKANAVFSAAASDHQTCFESQRSRILALAWRMLGSRHEALDLVQDLWLDWREVDFDGLQEPQAYLVRMATNLCIDRLRRVRQRRECYVGIWLPEPQIDLDVGTVQTAPPDELAQAQSVSIAFLHVLDVLGPLERAAFLLHDVFDMPFSEIARHLGRSEAACRQLASRARMRLRSRQSIVNAAQGQALTGLEGERWCLLGAFMEAAAGGEVRHLAALLHADAELLSDGGGVVTAIPQPVQGAAGVARILHSLLQSWQRYGAAQARLAYAHINGSPGLVAVDDQGAVTMALALDFAPDTRLCGVYFMRNPHKLRDVIGLEAVRWVEQV